MKRKYDKVPLPSVRVIRKWIQYDPVSGAFLNRIRYNHSTRKYETLPKPVLVRSRTGATMRIGDHQFLKGRLAMKLMKGRVNDTHFVTHLDGDPTNYKFANLISVNRQQFVQMSLPMIVNKSGYTGVFWNKDRDRWEAYIGLNKKRIGKRFLHKQDAINWRLEKEAEFFKTEVKRKRAIPRRTLRGHARTKNTALGAE